MKQVVTTDEAAGFSDVGHEWIGQRVRSHQNISAILLHGLHLHRQPTAAARLRTLVEAGRAAGAYFRRTVSLSARSLCIGNRTCCCSSVDPGRRRWSEQVQQAFNAVDVDGSGLLDRDEIRILLENLGKRPTEADIDGAMAELDVDSSGAVDFEEFSAYWNANFGSDGDGSGGILQGLTVNLSEPLWRVLLDSGKCIELPGDRVLAALTQYAALLPELLSDLSLALESVGQIEPHLSRARLNAAVLWSTEWGLEQHTQARQVKLAARDIMEELRAAQLSALEAYSEQCVAAVGDWDWRSNQLGKRRFDRTVSPPAINVLDLKGFDFRVTSGAPAYPPVVSIEISEKLATGTSPDDGYLRWQALASVQQADQERCAAVLEAQRCFLSSVEWAWDATVQRIDKDTAASGKLVAQRDVMTGKILQGEWRLESNVKHRWANVIEAVKAGWEASMHPWERGDGEDSEESSEEEVEAGKMETRAAVDSESSCANANETNKDESVESDTMKGSDGGGGGGGGGGDGDGWTEHEHPGTGRAYYVNCNTQETSWIKPPELEMEKQQRTVVTELQQEQRCPLPHAADPPSAQTSTSTSNHTGDTVRNGRDTGSSTGSAKASAGASAAARDAAKQRRAKRASRIQARRAAVSGGPGSAVSAGSKAGTGGASINSNQNAGKETQGKVVEEAVAGDAPNSQPKAAGRAAQGQSLGSLRAWSTTKAKSRAARIAAKKHAAKSAAA